MLLQLNIVNFALIENLSICFDEGFNVFSGETGAGKSILVDAINYVLGSKFSKDLIRTGEVKTYVEAIFTVVNPKTEEVLKEYDIEFDDMVIISRETFNTGRSIIKVNGKSLILSALKHISSTLLDIHGQHENQNLLEASNHITYLDYFSGDNIKEFIDNFTNNYKKLNEIKSKLAEISGNDGEREKLVNYLKYQIQEIDACKLKVGEEEELKERYEMLTHAERINKALCGSYEILYSGSDSTTSVFDSLDNVIRDLRGVQNYFEKAKDFADSLQEAYFTIEQNISEIRSIKDDIYYDADELADINNRIYEISKMKKKYGSSIEEILEYRQKIQNQYDEYVNSDEIIETLNREKEIVYNRCIKLAKEIHEIRVNNSVLLQEKIKNELDYIGLEKSTFIIDVKFGENLTNNGCDEVQFLISTNPGEPIKSLEKVASGGELSRIMLALKTVFVDKDRIPTVIFDEIDTGISGRVAQRVAEKMFLISRGHQVLCVTHLSQIAGMSDAHYLVHKNMKNDKTFTNVEKLKNSDKELEIARMIGGAEVTKLTIQNAKELIGLAENIKKKII
ncbi:MAG: recN [Bacillota bacterium]|jgi:DNA repair protein RecN (Recombination protein N)|nr:recN [Bacillota bacterium]